MDYTVKEVRDLLDAQRRLISDAINDEAMRRRHDDESISREEMYAYQDAASIALTYSGVSV
jgi:hypothetical protein